ncbi:hypothetical protein DM01DRAFT_240945, partial [Hesseltinella vesiculosa]
VDDLTELKNFNNEVVANALRTRFLNDKICTRIAHSVMVVLHPFQNLDDTMESQREIYYNDYKDTKSSKSLEPHIFQQVNQTYFHMRRTGQDQSILLSGVDGHGKSETHDWVLSYLLTLSSRNETTPRRRLHTLIDNAHSLFKAFGHTQQAYGYHSSKFGSLTSFQFNDRGRLIGCKWSCSSVDASSLSTLKQPGNSDERSFYMFDYVLYGMPRKQMDDMKVEISPSTFTSFMPTHHKEDLPESVRLRYQEFYDELQNCAFSLGITKQQWRHLLRILVAILHLGSLSFGTPSDQSRYAPGTIHPRTTLTTVADLLAIDVSSLENILVYKTKLIGSELATHVLTAHQAAYQRDCLCQTIYTQIIFWLIKTCNQKLDAEIKSQKIVNNIHLIDYPALAMQNNAHNLSTVNTDTFNKFVANFTNESVESVIREKILGADSLVSDQSGKLFNSDMPFMKAWHTVQPSTSQPENHLTIAADMMNVTTQTKPTLYHQNDRTLSIQHTDGVCNTYSLSAICDSLTSQIYVDTASLFSPSSCRLQLIVEMFHSVFPAVDNPNQPEELRNPCSAVERALSILRTTNMWWTLYALRKSPFTEMTLYECARRYVSILEEEGDDYSQDDPLFICQTMKTAFTWNDSDYCIVEGSELANLSYTAWYALENMLRSVEKSRQKDAKCSLKEKEFENASFMSICPGEQGVRTFNSDYHCSVSCQCEETNTTSTSHRNIRSASTSAFTQLNQSCSGTQFAKQHKRSGRSCFYSSAVGSRSRLSWVCLTWSMTWWLPSFVLHYVGGMKRSDIRMAWREKVTLCIFIFALCGTMVWFIAFFGKIICPPQDLFSQSELQSKTDKDNALISIRGEVFDLTSFAPRHWASEVIPSVSLFQYAGQDASDLFPVQVSALCDGIDQPIPKEVALATHINITDPTSAYHDFRYSRADYRPDWFMEQMIYLRKNYRVGFMGYDAMDVQNQASNPVQLGGIQSERQWAVLHGRVYDLTSYLKGGVTFQYPPGANTTVTKQLVNSTSMDFIDNSILGLFRQLAGTDISAHFDALPFSSAHRQSQLTCLRNLFFVGMVDTRISFQCQFSEYLLLLITTFLCSVILFKFLAAFRLGGSSAKESVKFVVCQVPCYTEGEDSLRKTIESLAVMKYDDQRKLLFLVADGMIIGSGNDRSTPRIVLDILGFNLENDPEPKDYVSLGEGWRQHNRAKVYSGLYECHGHVVPYLVVVKVGTSDERQKSGNRGKRDSQMILMQFFNKVHYNSPMTPLELEMHHQLKNVIGVMPAYYEFVLMVDADTEVAPDSLNQMVSSFSRDNKLVGLCGETLLSNEKDSWVTMIQVYEYYISHHLSKAFESLFGCVTCLPGCFCMYRIWAPKTHLALLVSDEVIFDYAENKVDTLHKKNLLHLGEDRYLTTLILKHFPSYRTKFNPDASCRTNGPDQWNVLLSQRRRWINSTVHNLGELLFLPQLCGLCCFSMRFIVMLDLLSTLVMPAVVCYLGYLVYQLCTSSSQVPLMSILTLGGVYGLQAILFIARRKWEHIGWMVVYILAIPVFSFLIPIYAFWHFDDFSWGNTRQIHEFNKKTKEVPAENIHQQAAAFNIPMMHWIEDEE